MRELMHARESGDMTTGVWNTNNHILKAIGRPEHQELFLSAMRVSNAFGRTCLTDAIWLEKALSKSGGDASLPAFLKTRQSCAYSMSFLRF